MNDRAANRVDGPETSPDWHRGPKDLGLIVLAFSGFWLSILLAIPTTLATEPVRPNVVLIVADDMGWADVGYHGAAIATPHLDALAASGVKLENHYVFPTCSPTRTALLTGRNPSRFGIMGPIGGRSTLAVPTDTLTLADVLATRGYRTAIAGKWHLGLRPEVGPKQYGFASSYGYLHGQIDPFTHLYKNGDRTWHREDRFLDEPGHATDLIAADAVRVIEESRGRPDPFFLYVAFSVPHTPLDEEERWVKPYEGKFSDPSKRLYAAAVTHMDDAIGRIVASLDRSGRRDETMIVFTSDNGAPKGSDDGNVKDYGGKFGAATSLGDNLPLRGWKGQVFEGGIRVPAFVNWRGKLSPRSVTVPIIALDWLPTLAKLTGFQGKKEDVARWEGVDVWPYLAGVATGSDRVLYWKTDNWVAIREGAWKLVLRVAPRPKPGEPPHAPLLFDLAADPNETTDLAGRHPDRVRRLMELLRGQQALDPEKAGS